MADVTSECDVCVVYNADASLWREYIEQLVAQFVERKGVGPLHVQSIDDASLIKKGHLPALPRAAIVVVVLSPAHLEFLRSHRNINYRKLVDNSATNSLVLRCGVACFDDLANQDSPIFTQFFGWTKLEDIDNGNPVTRAVDRLLSTRQMQDAGRRGSEPAVPHPISPPSASRTRTTSDKQKDRSSVASTHSSGSDRSDRSSGSWKRTSNTGSTTHFQVIPTTIRCEVRQLYTGFMNN